MNATPVSFPPLLVGLLEFTIAWMAHPTRLEYTEPLSSVYFLLLRIIGKLCRRGYLCETVVSSPFMAIGDFILLLQVRLAAMTVYVVSYY